MKLNTIIKISIVLILFFINIVFSKTTVLAKLEGTKAYFTEKPYYVNFTYEGKVVSMPPVSVITNPDNTTWSAFEFKDYTKKWKESTLYFLVLVWYPEINMSVNITQRVGIETIAQITNYPLPKTTGQALKFNANFFYANKPVLNYIYINDVQYNGYNITANPNDYTDLTMIIPPGYGNISMLHSFFKWYNVTYAPPTVSQAVENNNLVTVTGDNFYIDPKVVVVTLDSTTTVQGDAIKSTDHQKLVFGNEFTYTDQNKLSISIGGVNSVKDFSFPTYPSLLNSTSSPNKGGLITITGKRLNAKRKNGDPSVIKVTIDGKPCTDVKNIIDGDFGSISCNAPFGIKDGLDVFVEIDSLKSAVPIKFSFSPPVITSVSQSDDVFTIFGESLGVVGQSKVIVNGQEYTNVDKISDQLDSLTIKLPKSVQSGVMQVTWNAKQSPVFEFNVKPMITSITNSTSLGSKITISGFYLFQHKFNSTEPLNITMSSPAISGFQCGQQDAVDAQVDNGTTLVCTAGPGVGLNNKVTLTIDSLSNTGLLSYQAPTLDNAHQDVTDGVISGTNFGFNKDLIQILFAGKVYPATAVQNHTIVRFDIPKSSVPGPISIKVAGQPSGQVFFSLSPVLSGYSNITTEGGLFIIQGLFFNKSSVFNVTVGGKECTNAKVHNDNNSLLECILKSGTGANHTIHVTMDGKEISNSNITFAYDRPTVLAVSKVNETGGIITITGTSFGTPISVTVGDRPCHDATLINSNTTTCILDPYPSVEATPREDLTVLVTVDNLVSSGSFNNFKYDLPPPIITKPSEPESNSETSSEAYNRKLKWLIPAIIIPIAAFIVATALITILFVLKRQKRLRQENSKDFKN
ncbi:hypothetical protein CYY_009182 [Polysphondylium violaceum]|uniref:IPT/TIG domain-containing protein n=1 Tax=Polysphondylium violaceum TaxID=133409 RepID=A0A8J4PLZ1_9MYCE|nr:hypothetical protein CYY_009182 [Polysphondylium violaceum]